MLVHSDFFVGGTVCGAVLSHENLACIQGGQAEVLLERQRTIVHQKYSVQNHRERERERRLTRIGSWAATVPVLQILSHIHWPY